MVRTDVTPEVVALYRRGLELKDKRDCKSRDEYSRIVKRLEWGLLDRPPHMVSILDWDAELEGEEPKYLARKSSASHPDFSGWISAREIRRQLLAALAHNVKAER